MAATEEDLRVYSANRIRARYLAYEGRRRFLQNKPIMHDPIKYRAFLKSNEPEISVPEHLKPESARFVVVGTSILRSLQLVADLMPDDAGPSTDGYINIPKLFLLDFSSNTHNIWRVLKNSFANAVRIDEFNAACSKEHNLEILSHTGIEAREVIDAISELFSKPDLYDFIRNVVAKATVILGDWTEPRNFEYIRRCVDSQPIYVYTSNIIEVSFNNLKRRKILENLCSLEPVMSIHARTSKAVFFDMNIRKPLEENISLYPNFILISEEKNPAVLYEYLNSTKDAGESLISFEDDVIDEVKAKRKEYYQYINSLRHSIMQFAEITYLAYNPREESLREIQYPTDAPIPLPPAPVKVFSEPKEGIFLERAKEVEVDSCCISDDESTEAVAEAAVIEELRKYRKAVYKVNIKKRTEVSVSEDAVMKETEKTSDAASSKALRKRRLG